MALPNTGITTTMVGQELGISTRNVGNLCTSTAINKWSRWKPVRYNKLTGITDNDLRYVRSGMNVQKFTSIPELLSFYRGGTSPVWGYNKPRGGTQNEFYRLGDFRTYEQQAQQFYTVSIPNATSIPNNIAVNLYTVSSNPNWLNWESLMFDNFYFGAIAIRNGSSTPPYTETLSTQPLGVSGGSFVDIDLPSPSIGQTYQIFTFLAETVPYPLVARYWALEGGFGSINYTAVLTAMFQSSWSGPTLNWTLWLYNNTSNPINVLGAHLYFRYGGNSLEDPQEVGEFSRYLASPITVSSSQPTIITGSEFGILEDFSSRGGMAYFINTSYPGSNRSFSL